MTEETSPEQKGRARKADHNAHSGRGRQAKHSGALHGLWSGGSAGCAAVFALVVAAGCTSSGSSNSHSPVPDAGGDAVSPVTYDFSKLRDYLFAGSWKTEGVVVMHDGAVVYEEYAGGFDGSKRHIMYSVSKSVGATLAGIAVNDGVLAWSDSVCKYVPPPIGADPTLCNTTIEHLIHMSSGLKWVEDYGDTPSSSDVLRMLYGDEADEGAYVAAHPRVAPPGSLWHYSSGDSNLLARALRGALAAQGQADMLAWAKRKLFEPAGMSSAMFEADASGTLVFAAHCFMTPRDMGRFGQLYLDDGMKGGTRVLPLGWVKYATTPAPADAMQRPRVPDGGPDDTGGSYGASIWLNAAAPDAPKSTWEFAEATADTYLADGHWGQKIVVVPSRKLVIARTGNDRVPRFETGPMIGLAVAAVDAGAK